MSSNDQILLIDAAVLLLVPFVIMTLIKRLFWMWGSGDTAEVAISGRAVCLWLTLSSLVLGVVYLPYRRSHRAAGRTETAPFGGRRVAYLGGDLSDEEFETRRERLQREE